MTDKVKIMKKKVSIIMKARSRSLDEWLGRLVVGRQTGWAVEK